MQTTTLSLVLGENYLAELKKYLLFIIISHNFKETKGVVLSLENPQNKYRKMIEHHVIDILKALSTEEIKQFRRFLASPYFIRSETVNSLFELLIKFHPNFTGKKLTKEYISENISKKEKYSDSTVRNALADLLNICEIFLMQENFRKSATISFDYLLKELREKNLGNVFLKNTNELDKEYTPVKNVDSEYYLSKYRLELNKFNYNTLYEKIKDNKDSDIQFNKVINSGIYITIHYIIEIVSIYVVSMNYAMSYNIPFAKNFLSSIINTINIKGLESLFKNNEHSFLVQIYIALLKTFENLNDDKFYYSYKSLVKQNIDKLGKDEIAFHFSNLTNYCYFMKMDVKQIQKYDDELFSLYEEMLQNNYYQSKKSSYLRVEVYRNILLLGLKHKKMKWVENFILNYSSKLHKSERDNMMNLAYAYLYYEKGEYMQSWKYFNKIKIDYFYYKYDIKNYALKIYYELGYYDEALMLTENYKKFLDRSELISEEEKTAIKNFISYFSKLILFRVGQLPQKHFSTYRKRLEQNNDTMSRYWLIQKYEEQATTVKQSRIAKSA